MHEFAVTRHMVVLVIDEATKAGAARVTAIGLAIGEFSSLIAESIRLYIDVYNRDNFGISARPAPLFGNETVT